MAFLTWTSEFSVGVPAMDKQHRELVTMLNELHDVMKLGQGDHRERPLLSRLIEYAREHFAAEEKLLEAAHYPQFPEHQLQHITLIARVVDLVTRAEEAGCALNVDLLYFLRDWLQMHFRNQDTAYGPWLLGQDVLRNPLPNKCDTQESVPSKVSWPECQPCAWGIGSTARS